MARHQGCTGGRAGRGHMIIGQPDRLVCQSVKMGSLNHRISGAPKIAVALVIRNHKDNIGPFLFEGRSRQGEQAREDNWNEFKNLIHG